MFVKMLERVCLSKHLAFQRKNTYGMENASLDGFPYSSLDQATWKFGGKFDAHFVELANY